LRTASADELSIKDVLAVEHDVIPLDGADVLPAGSYRFHWRSGRTLSGMSAVDSKPAISAQRHCRRPEMTGFASPAPSSPVVEMAGFANRKYLPTVLVCQI
jgi:hypothetical protein